MIEVTLIVFAASKYSVVEAYFAYSVMFSVVAAIFLEVSENTTLTVPPCGFKVIVYAFALKLAVTVLFAVMLLKVVGLALVVLNVPPPDLLQLTKL